MAAKDPALQDLRRQFLAEQAKTPTLKLSERNCIEVVQKLIERKYCVLFPSSSGREYLSWPRLEKEIKEILQANGGRISVVELPNETGVNVEYCESALGKLVHSGFVRLLFGDALTSACLYRVSEEIDDLLEQSGCLALADVAINFNFPAEFVKDEILPLLRTPHEFAQNTLYTKVYTARIRAKLRGTLRGAISPVSLLEIGSAYKISSDMITSAVQSLIKSGEVHGKMQAGSFSPKVFDDAQTAEAESFVRDNGYLPHAIMRSFGIKNPSDWFAQLDIKVVKLHSAYIQESLLDPVLAGIRDACSTKTWVDVLPLLPSALVKEDALEALRFYQDSLSNCHVVGQFVVSAQFTTETIAAFDELIKKCAADAPSVKAHGGPKNKKDEKIKGAAKKRAKKKTIMSADDEDEARGVADTDFRALCMPLLEELGILDEFLEEYWTVLEQLIMNRVRAEKESLRSKKSTDNRSDLEARRNETAKIFEQVEAAHKALEQLDLDKTALNSYLWKTMIATLLHAVLSLALEVASGELVEVTPKNRQQVLKTIVEDGGKDSECFNQLCEIAHKRESFARFFTVATACFEEVHVFVRKKKRDKAKESEYHLSCKQQFEVIWDCSGPFPLSMMLYSGRLTARLAQCAMLRRRSCGA
eukprot:GEMP01027185.1.p1 GENE.GEMP01027185.1~~GEMP01027185.1.p1  ORF type:complete len:645 (+),score=146.71 GEMP01027185.1:69-2003(+)